METEDQWDNQGKYNYKMSNTNKFLFQWELIALLQKTFNQQYEKDIVCVRASFIPPGSSLS